MFGFFFAGGAWEVRHGILFMGAGLLMLAFRPSARVPRGWWWMAGAFVLLGCGVFLPVEWIGMPEWRRRLEALGLDTGSLQVVEVRVAAEMLGVFAVTLLVGLWLAGRRVSAVGLGRHVLLFAMGVAAYAVVSRLALAGGDEGGTYGFFPNRNHTATLLAMGAICGLASFVQAMRDRKWGQLAGGGVAACVCFWAVLGWSESRGGLLLVAVGAVAFLGCVGLRYLGRHSGRAVLLLGILVVGGFLIANSALKARIRNTAEKLEIVPQGAESKAYAQWAEKEGFQPPSGLDFRLPVWRDTVSMIASAPWTGHGAGQFASVFPQFRDRSIIVNGSDCLHPESDWL